MRFDSVRLPLAGALLLAAAGLTFAWGTDPNGAASEPIAATQSTAAAMLAVRDAPLAAVTAVPHPAVLHSAVRHAAPKHAARVHAAPVHAAVVRMKPIHRAAGHAPAVHAALVRGKAVHVALRPAVVAARRPLAQVKPAPPSTPAASRKGSARATAPKASVAILRFIGRPGTIVRGDLVTLCATANGATRLRLVPVAALDPKVPNCRILRPRRTTTYTLLAQGPAGDKVTQNVTIVVHKQTPPLSDAPEYNP